MTRFGYFNGIKMNLPEDTEMPLDIDNPALEHLIEKGIIAARVNKNRILERLKRKHVFELQEGTKKLTKKELEDSEMESIYNQSNYDRQKKAETNSARIDVKSQITDLYSSETNQDQQIELYTEEAKEYLSGLKLRLNDTLSYNIIIDSLVNPENPYDDKKVFMFKQLSEEFEKYSPIELAYAVAQISDIRNVEHIIEINKLQENDSLIKTVDDFMNDIKRDEDMDLPESTSELSSKVNYHDIEKQDRKKVSRSDISKHNVPNFPPRNMMDGILPANPIELEKQLDGAGMHIEKGLKF